MEPTVTGVGVLDKSVAILRALAGPPNSLGEVVSMTGIPKPTAYRLLTALASHGLVRRGPDGGYALGAEIVVLAGAAARGWPWGEAAEGVLAELSNRTGESSQLYVREGNERICLLVHDSTQELRTIVAAGARLPLGAGSAGRILSDGFIAETSNGELAIVESVEERAPGVASLSAPIVGHDGALIAAIGISGPMERLAPSPQAMHAGAVRRAALSLSEVVARQARL